MTAVLQLLVFVATIAGLVLFGFYRDKKEHNQDTGQTSIYFPETRDADAEAKHERVAMSRIG